MQGHFRLRRMMSVQVLRGLKKVTRSFVIQKRRLRTQGICAYLSCFEDCFRPTTLWGTHFCHACLDFGKLCQGIQFSYSRFSRTDKDNALFLSSNFIRSPRKLLDLGPAWLQPPQSHNFVQRCHCCNYNPNSESITHCVNHPQKIAFSFSVSITHNCTLCDS